MTPYLYPRPYSPLYHPWWYYRGLDDVEPSYHLYSLSKSYLPLDPYDYRFISHPHTHRCYRSLCSPTRAYYDLDLKHRLMCNLYDYIPHIHSPSFAGPLISAPIQRSRSSEELDEYLRKKERSLSSSSPSHLSLSAGSLSKRSSSVENLLALSRVHRSRLAGLYEDMGKHFRLDPLHWSIWYNPVVNRAPVMFRHWLTPFVY